MKILNIANNNFNSYKNTAFKASIKTTEHPIQTDNKYSTENGPLDFFSINYENGDTIATKVALPSEKKLIGCFSVEKFDKNNNKKKTIEIYLSNTGAYSCRMLNIEDVKELSTRLQNLNKNIQANKDKFKNWEIADTQINKTVKYLEKVKLALEKYYSSSLTFSR